MIKIYKVNKEHPNLLDQLNKKHSCGTVLVYSDHCPHCTSMKPQWEQMKKKLHNKPANIYEINSEDLPYINHPIKNIVDGFPMIVNVNNRNIVPFNDERTLDNFVKFAESNILNMAPPPQKTNTNVIKGNQLMDSLNLDKYIDKKMPFLNVHKKAKSTGKRKAKSTGKRKGKSIGKRKVKKTKKYTGKKKQRRR